MMYRVPLVSLQSKEKRLRDDVVNNDHSSTVLKVGDEIGHKRNKNPFIIHLMVLIN